MPDDRKPADSAAGARLAREALARVRADAQAKGHRPKGPAADPADQAELLAGGAPAGQSRPPRAPRPQGRGRREDPQPLQAAIGGLLDEQGWRQRAVTGSVFAGWDQIVGAELAAHTRPDTLADGELVVIADSTAWATQVRLLAAALVRRLNAELGDGVVVRVRVRGPAPPRSPGAWRVRGGRGPRDTYG